MSPRYPGGGPRPGVRMPQQVDFNVRLIISFVNIWINYLFDYILATGRSAGSAYDA